MRGFVVEVRALVATLAEAIAFARLASALFFEPFCLRATLRWKLAHQCPALSR